MIPMEMLAASISFLAALVGGLGIPLGEGTLHSALAHGGEHLVWLVLLGAPSVALFILAAREWKMPQLKRNAAAVDNSCRWRSRAAGVQALSWIYGLKLLAAANGASWFGVLSAVMVVFLGWSYIENRRVRREIKHQTTAFMATGR